MRNPPDPKAFYVLVWQIVQQIPSGCVSTYGQIASMIPPPEGVLPPTYTRFGAQWVGQAMRETPEEQSIPWQRVINSQGKVSFPEGSPGAEQQRARLEAEGVIFSESGRVNFNVYGWGGPDATWLQENGLLPPTPLKKKDGGQAQPKLF
jgi:methylated-DNA-protein-cysteine methyltransferase-like protein